MKPITARQQAVLDFIREHIARFGYAPSVADIARAFDFCRNAAMHHVHALELKLYLQRGRFKARAIRVLRRFAVRALDGELVGIAVPVDSGAFDDLG